MHVIYSRASRVIYLSVYVYICATINTYVCFPVCSAPRVKPGAEVKDKTSPTEARTDKILETMEKVWGAWEAQQARDGDSDGGIPDVVFRAEADGRDVRIFVDDMVNCVCALASMAMGEMFEARDLEIRSPEHEFGRLTALILVYGFFERAYKLGKSLPRERMSDAVYLQMRNDPSSFLWGIRGALTNVMRMRATAAYYTGEAVKPRETAVNTD